MRTTVRDPLVFEVLAEGLGFPEGPVACDDGSVLVVDIDSGRVLRVGGTGRGGGDGADGSGGGPDRGGGDGRPGAGEGGRGDGFTVVATPGGGPNGLALGPDGHGYVANNGGFLWTEVNGVRIPIDHATHTNEPPGCEGGWVERVDLASGAVTVVADSCGGRRLRGPNDLVFDQVGGLWFTDHGKGRLASVDRGGLYYLPPGGGEVREVAFPLLGPNGVGLSPGGDRAYVAETHTGRLWAWDLAGPGEVRPASGSLAVRHGGTCLAATRYSFDSLAVEEDGRIVIGAIGDGLVVITPDGQEAEAHPIPGDVTTNIAFGGPDRRRALVTLSRSGRLVEARWPRPGLALAAPGPRPS